MVVMHGLVGALVSSMVYWASWASMTRVEGGGLWGCRGRKDLDQGSEDVVGGWAEGKGEHVGALDGEDDAR